MTHFVDIGVLMVALVLSAVFVFRFGVVGFFIGVITVWALGILRIELLYRLDPQRDAAMLDAGWVLVVSWVVGIAWCATFFTGLWLYRRWQVSAHYNDRP